MAQQGSPAGTAGPLDLEARASVLVSGTTLASGAALRPSPWHGRRDLCNTQQVWTTGLQVWKPQQPCDLQYQHCQAGSTRPLLPTSTRMPA